MKILVTGGAGYVGNTLCRDLLRRGYKVRCADNFWKGHADQIIELIPRNGFEFMEADVAIKEDVKKMLDGVDGIIHLAALVGFPACKKYPTLATEVNVNGTKNLVEEKGDLPMVFASTGSVYGKVEGVCTEESPLNAVSHYGVTKKLAEDLVTNAKNSVSFRFATGFGVSPNMRVNLLVNDLVYQAVTNKSINIFQPDFRRTFIHVKDMSRAFIFGLENIEELLHKVYNCGSNDLNWTKRELAEYIKKETGCFLSYNESGVDEDQRDYEVDYSKLNNEGFHCAVSMEQGLNELIRVVPLLKIKHQYM